ncbi:MAG: methyltransferase domain-containing protein [Anaerolineaceae bacterium]|nr:methyltransferase domain-containing protein [Anaerolineaceae bacterium]
MNTAQNDPLRDSLREAYDKYAQERDASEMEEWKIAPRANFLSILKQEQKKTLLEIGAGPGRDSLFFQEHGLETTCIDLSPAMVALCRQKGLAARVMDMGDLQFPKESFDAVYALNCLLHLPKVEFPKVLRGIHGLLKADGLFFLGVYGGYDYEGVWESDYYTPNRFFSFFADEHLEREVAQVFEILSFERILAAPDNPVYSQLLVLRKPIPSRIGGGE